MFDNSIITNQLFYEAYEGEESLYSEFKDYKLLLVLDFLYRSLNRYKTCTFSLELLIKKCGFKIDNHKGKSVEQFKQILYLLQSKGYIIYDEDFRYIKPSKCVDCTVDLRIKTKFTLLPNYVKDKIMNYNKIEVNNTQLLFYWCYLHSRIHRRKYEKSDEDIDIKKYAGRPKTCFVTYEKINKEVGLTESTVNKYNKILADLNLLRYKNNGMIQKDKVIKESCNVYYTISREMFTEEIDKINGDIQNNINEGLKQQLYYYKQNGWTKTKSNKNNRTIAGKIGVLTRLKNENKATEEQLDELENLKALVEENRKYEASQKFKVGIVTKNKINKNQE